MDSRQGKPLISVIIPNYNGAFYLEACLRSLERQTFTDSEVVVVDNASRDSSVEIIRRVAPWTRILCLTGNSGFAGAVNRGLETAQGEWVAVLNNDTEVAEDWLDACVAAMERHQEASFLACRILDHARRNIVYSAGDCFLRACIGYRRGQDRADGAAYEDESPVFSPCGCAALFRRDTLIAAGGFDENFFAYLEDLELGLRLQAAGLVGYYVPSARVYHIGGATSGGEFSRLAVRLRTRNSVLLLVKSVPLKVLIRCMPMIASAQAVWFGRALAHGRLLSYLHGLAGVVAHVPAMAQGRRRMRETWKEGRNRLWQAIVSSEQTARLDFESPGPGTSRFLVWYFRTFRG